MWHPFWSVHVLTWLFVCVAAKSTKTIIHLVPFFSCCWCLVVVVVVVEGGAAVVWWWMGWWVGQCIPCCSFTELSYALIGSLWLERSHTRCIALHSWVNLAHELNYCVAKEKWFHQKNLVAIYTGAIQWPAEEFITLLIWQTVTPEPVFCGLTCFCWRTKKGWWLLIAQTRCLKLINN